MTPFDFGEILLVAFPFTDQSATKRRPAVVISSEAYHSQRLDVIVMAITSQLRASSNFAEIQILQWQGAGLKLPSAIKPVIATLAQTIVLKRLGRLQEQDQHTLRLAIGSVVLVAMTIIVSLCHRN